MARVKLKYIQIRLWLMALYFCANCVSNNLIRA